MSEKRVIMQKQRTKQHTDISAVHQRYAKQKISNKGRGPNLTSRILSVPLFEQVDVCFDQIMMMMMIIMMLLLFKMML